MGTLVTVSRLRDRSCDDRLAIRPAAPELSRYEPCVKAAEMHNSSQGDGACNSVFEAGCCEW